LLIKYIKSVLWRVAKCLSYIEEARCLKVKQEVIRTFHVVTYSNEVSLHFSIIPEHIDASVLP